MNYNIPYKNIPFFSKFIIDYIYQDDKLKSFVNHFPILENFEKQIQEKKNHFINRDNLVKILKIQNDNFFLTKSTKKNIDLLKLNNTFSVTTGHQLCLFTGPLYFIYKIISTINLCEQLAKKYPSNNFVPIFWMASEDHDFKEVNHINLFGKQIKWTTKQTGAVGRMNLNDFESVILELKSVLGSNKNADKLLALFKKSYLNNNNLVDATRCLVNELFGKYGLVVIDGNHRDFKKDFIPQMKKDILKKGFVDIIKDCSVNLAQSYKSQAFVRNINFFKLCKDKRVLIEGHITEREIEEHPEIFSPNVLLRPLYQEVLLPNVAYVGGEAELAYWMQLKSAFQQEHIPFPILVLRNSALLIDEKKRNIFESLDFELKDLFLSEDELQKRYVLKHANLDISLVDEKNDLNHLYENILLKNQDLGFQNNVKSQLNKQFSFFDKLQKKLIRLEKKKNEIAINRIEKIKQQCFPDNVLQERCINFIPYYLQSGDNFIKTLKNNFDPLCSNFVVLTFKS